VEKAGGRLFTGVGKGVDNRRRATPAGADDLPFVALCSSVSEPVGGLDDGTVSALPGRWQLVQKAHISRPLAAGRVKSSIHVLTSSARIPT